MNTTTQYYNDNAQGFVEGTVNVDMGEIRKRFTAYLEDQSHILDCGCGSGRDTLAFSKEGYTVTAIDGSSTLVEIATRLTGQNVLYKQFDAIEDIDIFEGIWACASLLHVPSCEIGEILSKLNNALKNKGVMYLSFKYGAFEGERSGRHFTDYTEATLKALILNSKGLEIQEIWTTQDVRPTRSEKWLNAIVKKKL